MAKRYTLGWMAPASTFAAALLFAGCGTPGAPQPPSLNLPDRVNDLSAVRAGNQVSLTWTMPKKTTDKLLLNTNVMVHICRRQAAADPCETAGTDRLMPPGSDGTYSETLPPALASGAPRALDYFVELKNHGGRSAGVSNTATVLAGEAPEPIANLSAEVRKSGIVLHWTPDAAAQQPVRLERKLLSPQTTKRKQDILSPLPEAQQQNLLVENGLSAGRALDKNIRFGQTYEYRAQRVARIASNGRTLELAGEWSAPVRVEARDIFPPAVPSGLAAVATGPENGAAAAIDLSWQPDSDSDLAGYAVYRREAGAEWRRISPAQPVVGPAFHDAPVQAGHTYFYAVTAIGQSGHESARSAEAQETVPQP